VKKEHGSFPIKEKFAKAWTNRMVYFGNTTTN